MDVPSVQTITSAVGPVVMVSVPRDAAHEPRRRQIADQLRLFDWRLRLSQRALEFLEMRAGLRTIGIETGDVIRR